MLETPFNFEPDFMPEEWQKLGQLTLRWSHIEHVIGNCLKVMLRLSDEEAIVVVFPMSLETRMTRIADLAKLTPLNAQAKAAYDELRYAVSAIQHVRNNVVHSVVLRDASGEHHFELRSKQRKLSKTQIFAAEELTNYAAYAAISFRYALGLKGHPDAQFPLPYRPQIPEYLQTYFPKPPSQRRAVRRARQRSSRKKSQSH